MLSIRDCRALKNPEPDFLEYLLSGPRVDDFEIERDNNTGREVLL